MQEILKKGTEVSERLLQVIDFLGSNPNDFAKRLGYERSQAIYDMLKGKSKPSFDFFEKLLSSEYSELLDLEWLVTGKGEMLKSGTKPGLEGEELLIKTTNDSTNDSKKKELLVEIRVDEPAVRYLRQNTREVIMLTQEAAASISGIISGQQHPEEASRVLLPATLLGQNGQYYGFKVRNDSMHPTLYDGDWVIGRYIEPSEWTLVVSERIYILSTREDGVKIKRIRNRLAQRGILRCRSDNKKYPPFEVTETDIVSLFEVKCRLSFSFPNEPALIQERMARLEDRMDDLEHKKSPEN
jgi:phage repressor protein C with HTH and peptisase S24 domain